MAGDRNDEHARNAGRLDVGGTEDTAAADAPSAQPVGNRGIKAAGIATVAALAIATVGGVAYLARDGAAHTEASPSAASVSGQSVRLPSLGLTPPGGSGDPGWPPSGTRGSIPEAAFQSSRSSAASTAEEIGMVEITATTLDGVAAGTGMVLSSEGAVVTNHHVVEGAISIRATVVSTGKTYRAQYLGSDARRDVAVLQLVDATELQTVDVSSSAVRAGEDVIAVGDAGGDGGGLTAASGTVSKVRRSITVEDLNGGSHRLHGLIKVAANLVGGESGGALLADDGTVVGMNVAASTSGGVGFAIPIKAVQRVFDAVMSGDDSGSVAIGYDGYLGVELYDMQTAVVAGVSDGGAAAKAGIRPRSTIQSVDGVRIATARQLRAAIGAHRPGDTIDIGWRTADGARMHATVTLGRAPIS